MVLNLTLRASSKILHYLTSFYILTSFNCIIKGIEVMQCISINMCIGLVHRIFISVFIFKFCMARWLYKYTRNVCSPLLTCVQCKNWGIKTEKCIFLVQCPNFFGLVTSLFVWFWDIYGLGMLLKPGNSYYKHQKPCVSVKLSGKLSKIYNCAPTIHICIGLNLLYRNNAFVFIQSSILRGFLGCLTQHLALAMYSIHPFSITPYHREL